MRGNRNYGFCRSKHRLKSQYDAKNEPKVSAAYTPIATLPRVSSGTPPPGNWKSMLPMQTNPNRDEITAKAARENLFNFFRDYREPVRSNSVMARSISSRAESAEERMPWTRRRKSSGFDARMMASSSVIRLRE
jgi:hypothetical protein